MPVNKRKLEMEIKMTGCSIKRTTKGHFLVLDPIGNPIQGYAVQHPGNEVLDVYVRKVRKAISQVKKT